MKIANVYIYIYIYCQKEDKRARRGRIGLPFIYLPNLTERVGSDTRPNFLRSLADLYT